MQTIIFITFNIYIPLQKLHKKSGQYTQQTAAGTMFLGDSL